MKDQILDIAEEQLKTGGYDALHFGAIATELETTRANLHHHFGTKERLATEATQRYVAASFAFMSDVLDRHAGDLPGYLAELEGLVQTRLRTRGAKGACVCAQLARGERVPEALRGLAEDYYDRKRERVRALVADSQAAGAIRPEADPDVLALLVTSFLLGVDQAAVASADPAALADDLDGAFTTWIAPYRA